MQNTANYNFKKPENTDLYNVQDFSDNMDAIDTALKGLENGNANTLNGLTAEEFVSNDNLLIDANFELYLEGTKKWGFGQGNGTVEKADSGITVTLTTAGIQFVQHTEKMYFAEDGYITISLEFGDVTDLATTNLVGYVDAQWKANWAFSTTTNNIVTGRFPVTKGLHSVGIGLYAVGIGAKANIKWAKLELGSIATPFIPPNKEVEKLKCGATNFRQKTETIITTLPTPTEECDYMVTGGDSTFPYPFGNLSIRKGSYSTPQEWIATFKTTGDDVRIYYNMYHNTNGWKGWRDISDGGNAKTVDGFHASDFLPITGGTLKKANSAVLNIHNTTANALYSLIAYYANSVNCGALGFYGANNPIFYPTDGSGNKALMHEGNYKSYALPLDGSVPMSGNLIINRGTASPSYQAIRTLSNGTVSKVQFWNNSEGSASIGKVTDAGAVVNSIEVTDDGIKHYSSVSGNNTVLHTGNSQKVVTSASAPSDTSALWVVPK